MTILNAVSGALAMGVRLQLQPEGSGVVVACFSPGGHESSQFYRMVDGVLSEQQLAEDIKFHARSCLESEFGRGKVSE